MAIFEELKERGLIAQTTHEEEVRDLLNNHSITFYTGFDPTADSLHVGHFLILVTMARMQRAGHRPIALIGGGTGMVGDPTGRTDMRQMMTPETVEYHSNCFKSQMANLIDFSNGKALMLNNADWLLGLNYIEFLRDVGIHYSVNKMLTYECFKTRLERGLSFLEFNYMLMQGYDFYKLNKNYDCVMQLGGDDQWANILGGIELIRRKSGKEAYGLTFSILATSDGKKMGKTQKGAVWLDPKKTSPFEFYQYWRNVGDADVVNLLKKLTFIPVKDIENEFGSKSGQELNAAKELLAYEVTKMVHGEEEASRVQAAAKSLFANASVSEDMPTKELPADAFQNGEIGILDLLTTTKIVPSKGEARRLVDQGGITVNDEKVESAQKAFNKTDFGEGYIILKKGKKSIFKVKL
ncbi:MAG: tyrosine--tRNA ligase [Bacillota bacterium]|nr:tyrosine--tRNA ligase [Bacillota bacterium]